MTKKELDAMAPVINAAQNNFMKAITDRVARICAMRGALGFRAFLEIMMEIAATEDPIQTLSAEYIFASLNAEDGISWRVQQRYEQGDKN